MPLQLSHLVSQVCMNVRCASEDGRRAQLRRAPAQAALWPGPWFRPSSRPAAGSGQGQKGSQACMPATRVIVRIPNMCRHPASMPEGHTCTATHPAACPCCNASTEMSPTSSCAAGICRPWLSGCQATAPGMPAPAGNTADGVCWPRHLAQQMPTRR